MKTKTLSFLGTKLECRYKVQQDTLEFLYVGVVGHEFDLSPLLNHFLLGRIDPSTGGLGVTPMLSVLAEMLEPSNSTSVAEVGLVSAYQIH